LFDIHLNPLRAKLISDYDQLQAYPYGGHSAIMGKVQREWQDVDLVLALFDANLPSAQSAYRQYVQDGINLGRRKDLVGGGLIRSQGGWAAVKALRGAKDYRKGDERILGDGDFVEEVLRKSEEKLERTFRLKVQGFDFNKILKRVAELLGISGKDILAGGKKRQIVLARSLLCYWATSELGISQAWLARRLGLSQPAVSLAVERGKNVVAERGYMLVE
jgi:hypothetical protein